MVTGVGIDVRATGGGGEDGCDDEVDGDDVDYALGNAGELLEQPAGVGGDHGFGHPETPDPTGNRLGKRRFDDRRTHDRNGDTGAGLTQAPFAERFGEGVGVGEAEAACTGTTRLGHPVTDPLLAEVLDSLGDQGCAGGAEDLGCFGLELAESLRGPAGLLCVLASLEGVIDLGAPVDLDEER